MDPDLWFTETVVPNWDNSYTKIVDHTVCTHKTTYIKKITVEKLKNFFFYFLSNIFDIVITTASFKKKSH